jgi:hypothetical protein
MGLLLDMYDEIKERIKKIPTVWDGKRAIQEMRANAYPHWKQMEWIGFYFQYLCESYLKDIFKFQFPRYGRIAFDGFYVYPFDFKAHAINTSSHKVIVNDAAAVREAIEEYGKVVLILALGEVEYNDRDRKFQKWHEKLKGGHSTYTQERIARGAWSRLRKVRFTLEQIAFFEIDNDTLAECGSFQTNFRNANGRPRRRKILIDIEKIDPIESLDFSL